MSNSFKKQLPLNILLNFFSFFLSVSINFFMTPLYIQHLGTDGLGMLRLALSLPMYTSLLTIVISGAVSRYLTIELENENFQEANNIFNTAFYSMSFLLLLLLPVFFSISYFGNELFELPKQFSSQVGLLFFFVLLSALVSVFSSMFMIPAYAKNRLDIINALSIISVLMQTILIVILLYLFPDIVVYIGGAFLFASLVKLFLSLKVWKRFAPMLQLQRSSFEFKTLKKISHTGLWMVINHLGVLFFLYIDLIVVNTLLGAKMTGEYSIVLQWSVMLRTFAGVLAGAFAPMLLITYAQNNFEKLQRLTSISMKFLGIIIAVGIGIVMGLSSPLLELWLGYEFIKLTPLMWIMLGHLAVNLSVLPLFSIQTAYNRIKIPALVSLFMGAFNILLAILFIKYFELELYGVAIASGIILTLKNAIFIPWYTARIMNINSLFFLTKTFLPIIVTVITFLLTYYLQGTIVIHTWGMLALVGFISVVAMTLFIWLWVLKNDEKVLVIEILFKKLNRYIN